MKSQIRPQLPPVPAGLDPEARRYLQGLTAALMKAFQSAYEDLAQGNATLTSYGVAATTANLAPGQMAIGGDGGARYLYVNDGGTIRKTEIT